jgi:CheY-like chemotaxis protein
MTAERPILIVDDDEDIRDVITIALEVRGYTVKTATDGVEVMELLSQGLRPALILLDVMMPNMDGPTVLAALRSNPELNEIPVVLLSGDTKIAETARQLHSDGYLVKPIGTEKLTRTVERFAASA